ncbi:MAG TPA: hypothetical protein VFR90_03990 [Methylibium sp.]|uniref:hypothetical protein n=1 Tax=Methylibium sp. TaxID=2067992 RepID=UPI002DB6194C|nr:hypothetical protein [Methylibium sp.]HEU4458260.1 hypothetical protein [Methylibium sp.]
MKATTKAEELAGASPKQLAARAAMAAMAFVAVPSAIAQDASPATDLTRTPPSGYVRLQGRVRPVDGVRSRTMARLSFDLCNAMRQMVVAEPQAFSAARQARLELLDSLTVEEMFDEHTGVGRREFRQAGVSLPFDAKAAAQSGLPPNCLAYRVSRFDKTTIWWADGSTRAISCDDEGRPKSVHRGRAKAPAFMRLDPGFAQRMIAGETCTEVPVSAAVIVPKGRCLWNRYAGRHEKNLPLETVDQVIGDEIHATAVQVEAGLPDRWLDPDRMPEGAQELLDRSRPPRALRAPPAPPPHPLDPVPGEAALPPRRAR